MTRDTPTTRGTTSTRAAVADVGGTTSTPAAVADAAGHNLDAGGRSGASLAQQHEVIAVETLNASGMRTQGCAYKKGLNRALADAALAEVRRMLAYKTRWYDSTLIKADRWYPSSQTCSTCGGRKPSLTLADRTFEGDTCGARIDRDLNAAINLARFARDPTRGEASPAGSGPVAGCGATRRSRPAKAATAAGYETPTLHGRPAGKTGTAAPQGEAA